jgi:ADP-heptose:LPS heptosyltransferase
VLVVIGTLGIGDAAESLPAFELIREHWPEATLAAGYFSDKQRPLLDGCGALSGAVQLVGGVEYAGRTLRGLRHNIRAMRGFDTVLFLHKRHRVAWPIRLAGRLAGARVLHRHAYRYADPRRTARSDFPEHVLFQKLAADLLLGVPLTRLRTPAVAVGADDRRAAAAIVAALAPHPPRAIINTQSGLPDWGIERYAQVANALARGGASVIVNGGARHQIGEYRRVAPSLEPAVALLERPSPGVLAAVIQQCDVYVGAANGPASLAMACGTPSVMLVGPGEHGYPGQERIGPPWWPRGDEHVVIARTGWCHAQRSAECRCLPPTGAERQRRRLKRAMKQTGLWNPWRAVRKATLRRLGRPPQRGAEPRPYPCLEAISVEEVVSAAQARLARAPTAPVPVGGRRSAGAHPRVVQ